MRGPPSTKLLWEIECETPLKRARRDDLIIVAKLAEAEAKKAPAFT